MGFKNNICKTEYNISNTQLYSTKYILITLFRYPRILSSPGGSDQQRIGRYPSPGTAY